MSPAAARRAARGPWDRYGWMMGAIWLVFLGFVVIDAVTMDAGWGTRVVALALTLLFAGVYVHGLVRLGEDGIAATERAALVHLGAMVAIAVVLVVMMGGSATSTLPYVVALAMFTVPLPLAVVIAVVATAAPWLLVWVGVAEEGSQFMSLVVLLVAATTGIVRFIDEGEAAHRAVREELAIVAERERVARDVHDVLGHSLTVVTAKAELAERLLDVDPERSRQELTEIRALTRSALAEIRATVSGLRTAGLGAELEAARRALAAAEIEADLPLTADAADPRHRLVMAWVLREAVTNVVRHSGARRCRVALGRARLEVTDDGCGARDATEGNGLRGIRERVAAAGGRLTVGPGPGGVGTRLEVTW